MSGWGGIILGVLIWASCFACYSLGRDRGRWEIFSMLDDETREEVIERQRDERDE